MADLGKKPKVTKKVLFLFREVKGSVKVQKDLEYLCTVLLNRNELEIEQAVMLHEKKSLIILLYPKSI